MKDWTTPDDIRKRVEREWASGRLLAARVPRRDSDDELPAITEFPFRIPLRKPKSGDLSARFVDVQAWIDELNRGSRYRLDVREVNHRVIGRQRLPAAAWLDSAADALVLTGHAREAKQFDLLAVATPVEFHRWLRSHPLKALDAAADWEQILAVVRWIREHPRSGLYLRQVSIPGVHTKVIERQRRVIDALLESVADSGVVYAAGGSSGHAPRDASGTDVGLGGVGTLGAEISGARLAQVEMSGVEISGRVSGAPAIGRRNWFENRYGFRSKPLLVRTRALDPGLELVPGAVDLTMPASALARHGPASDTIVLITENEINFLTLPLKANTLAIWGAGNRAPEALAEIGWLKHCRVYYWGDIDTHGFGILDRLRGVLPQVESLLMDREVLLSHRESWVQEPSQMLRPLPNLTAVENDLLRALQQNEFGPNVRLEQEFVGYGEVAAAVAGLGLTG
jgi:hypothetical protein